MSDTWSRGESASPDAPAIHGDGKARRWCTPNESNAVVFPTVFCPMRLFPCT